VSTFPKHFVHVPDNSVLSVLMTSTAYGAVASVIERWIVRITCAHDLHFLWCYVTSVIEMDSSYYFPIIVSVKAFNNNLVDLLQGCVTGDIMGRLGA
jgi:hypothetical protein